MYRCFETHVRGRASHVRQTIADFRSPGSGAGLERAAVGGGASGLVVAQRMRVFVPRKGRAQSQRPTSNVTRRVRRRRVADASAPLNVQRPSGMLAPSATWFGRHFSPPARLQGIRAALSRGSECFRRKFACAPDPSRRRRSLKLGRWMLSRFENGRHSHERALGVTLNVGS
jgi:hypothetical protein